MGKNILVISCDIAETRVALIESGIIAELHIERRGGQPRGGTVGDIYLGKVTRVLPGLQAAFVDIGLERAAFLHVEDLIRPDDFEAYLAGGRKHALGSEDGNGNGNGTPEDADAPGEVELADETAKLHESVPAGNEAELNSPSDAESVGEGEEGGRNGRTPVPQGQGEEGGAGVIDSRLAAEGSVPPSPEEAGGGAAGEAFDVARVAVVESAKEKALSAVGHPSELAASIAVSVEGVVSATSAGSDSPTVPILDDPDSEPPPPAGEEDDLEDLLDNPNLPGFTVTEPGAPMPRAPAPRSDAPRDGRGGDRKRRRRGRDRTWGRAGREEPQREVRETRGEPRDRLRSVLPGRLSKSTPIRDVVKEGQDIIVQITKEPIGTKGARCSSHISLPGRYVVYLPTLEHVGVSKRIGSEGERARLREAIVGMKPPAGGLIVRTVAEGLTKKQLKQDVGYLVHLWGEVAKKREGAKAPALLLGELDIVLKTARDLFSDDVDEIVIDDKSQYERLCRFVEMFMPERMKDVAFYGDDEPIFDAYGIEDEISRALSRKVPLPSGGYLIIDEAEALTAIDVNTGRYVGKGSKDMEETILKTNLEAVSEIAYQLRFRNIGGLIILDLIDMEKPSNREKVRKTLEEYLQRDKAKTTLNRISDLGLIEMTRKRTRESLGRLLHEPCFYCDGTGHLQSKETVAYEILREVRRKRHDLPGYTILVNCHPAVADLLTGSEKAALQDAETKYMRRIQVSARTEYHLEQFDLTGK
ncbi:MAG TPA: Rne/Rng family ribonuclease [Polyangiaceae bacterium]|nr:Rne/Rng family ribonuclease [Polyangiaceae bacterium]